MRQQNGLNQIIKKTMIVMSLILAVFLSVKEAGKTAGRVELKHVKEWARQGAGTGLAYIWSRQYPAAVWEEEGREKEVDHSLGSLLCSLLFTNVALDRFQNETSSPITDEELDPAYQGYLESGKFYEEHSFLLYDGGEETGEEVQAPVTIENQKQPEEVPPTKQKTESMTCASSNVWPIIGNTYRIEQLADYDYMIKHFYSIHTSTTVGRDLMNADKFLSEDFTLKGGNEKPQILIYHTHSQEEFSDFGPANKDATVVGIGSHLTELLQAKGYHVIHDTSVYDLKNGKLDRNKAYTYALEGVTRNLQENPSIEVVLDIHRDGVSEKLHMVNKINGKMTAPIMFFNGVSQTPEGPIEYLPNPYKEKNLAFSFQMQLDCAAYFPGLTRKIYIKGLRYNQHLRPRSTLIEVGAQTNTYEEALNAMEPLSEVLDMVLQGN
ncbi:stage II sporulation protein P [Clostridium sp. E02]|uniref:stage II sporulation protein P n=1 Tax=Clostridium sp. E02 TaxID=2487134 RepID=UPI000F53DD47|nr:stage II sporulation protein P [Clostridium sp. E02]